MAAVRFEEFADKWATRYPAIIKLWRSAWEEFIPFLDYDVDIRKIICSTNAVERLNRRYRRAVRARGHFPTDQAALKCLYLVTRSLDPTGGARPAGRSAGSPRSTPSRSPSKAVSSPAPPTN
jgi:putative transposase